MHIYNKSTCMITLEIFITIITLTFLYLKIYLLVRKKMLSPHFEIGFTVTVHISLDQNV